MAKSYAKEAGPELAKALRASSVGAVNVSVQQKDGFALWRYLAMQGDILAGAGNVQTYEQAIQALDNGAAFIFSPCFDEQMIGLCQSRSVPIFPVTTQASLAKQWNLEVLGCYPVEELGGLAFIDRMAQEGGFSFFVAGHIEESMMGHYLSNSHVLGMTGSWMLRDGQDWEKVTEALRRARTYSNV
jgi:2-dehydro-3-deoxyphosphogluconate aldolase/(4S)-4-hydroxy-2-oxoglutarate aldolase